MNLMQGDCLERMAEIRDGSVDMILTDPPYGTTACKWDSIIPLEPMWTHLKRIIKPNGAVVLMGSQPFTSVLISSNLSMFKYCWYWEKNMVTGFALANKQPMRMIEDCIVFYKNHPVYNKELVKSSIRDRTIKEGAKNGSRSNIQSDHYNLKNRKNNIQKNKVSPRNLLKIKCVPHAGGHKVHPTQKPVALMEYLIRTYTLPGETVLDFTMGSGTTGVACRNLGRWFIGIEQDPEYFRIARERIYI